MSKDTVKKQAMSKMAQKISSVNDSKILKPTSKQTLKDLMTNINEFMDKRRRLTRPKNRITSSYRGTADSKASKCDRKQTSKYGESSAQVDSDVVKKVPGISESTRKSFAMPKEDILTLSMLIVKKTDTNKSMSRSDSAVQPQSVPSAFDGAGPKEKTASLIDPRDEVVLYSLLQEFPEKLERSKQNEEIKSSVQALAENLSKLQLSSKTDEMVKSFLKELPQHLEGSDDEFDEECSKTQVEGGEGPSAVEDISSISNGQERSISVSIVKNKEPPVSEPKAASSAPAQSNVASTPKEASQVLGTQPSSLKPLQKEILQQQETLRKQQLVIQTQQVQLLQQNEQLLAQQKVLQQQITQIQVKTPGGSSISSNESSKGPNGSKKKSQKLSSPSREQNPETIHNPLLSNSPSQIRMMLEMLELQRELLKLYANCELQNAQLKKPINIRNCNNLQKVDSQCKSIKMKKTIYKIKTKDNNKPVRNKNKPNSPRKVIKNEKLKITNKKSIKKQHSFNEHAKHYQPINNDSNVNIINDNEARKFDDINAQKTINSQIDSESFQPKISTTNSYIVESEAAQSKQKQIIRKYNSNNNSNNNLNTNNPKINKTVFKTNITVDKPPNATKKDSNFVAKFFNSYLGFICSGTNNPTKKKSETMFDNDAPDFHDPTVKLNVYGLTSLNRYLTFTGIGIYHSGVEVYGCEFAFGGYPEPVNSIFRMKKPRDLESLSDINGRFTFEKTIVIGKTDLQPHQINNLIKQLGESEWIGTNYHLIYKNCNNFSEEFVRLLTGKSIPEWINRVASVLVKFPYLVNQIPQEFVMPAALQKKIKREQAVKYALSRERDELKINKSSSNKKKVLEQPPEPEPEPEQTSAQPQFQPNPLIDLPMIKTKSSIDAVNTESFYTAATTAIMSMPVKATEDPVLQDLEMEEETSFKVPTPPVEEENPQAGSNIRQLQLKMPQTPNPQDLQDNKSRRSKKSCIEEEDKTVPSTTITTKVPNEARKEPELLTKVKKVESVVKINDEIPKVKLSAQEKEKLTKEISISHSRRKIRIRKKNRLPPAKKHFRRGQPSIKKGTFKMVDFNKNILAVPKSISKLKPNRVLKAGEKSLFSNNEKSAFPEERSVSSTSLSKGTVDSLTSQVSKSDSNREKTIRHSDVCYFSMDKSKAENSKAKDAKNDFENKIKKKSSCKEEAIKVPSNISRKLSSSSIEPVKIMEASLVRKVGNDQAKEEPSPPKISEEKHNSPKEVKKSKVQTKKIPEEIWLAQRFVKKTSPKDKNQNISDAVISTPKKFQNRKASSEKSKENCDTNFKSAQSSISNDEFKSALSKS